MLPTEIADELRRAPANMIGTEFEDFYWKLHDIANTLDPVAHHATPTDQTRQEKGGE